VSGLERTLPRAAYLSPEAFDEERERIFWRQWFVVGREEEVAAPGDYVVKDVAGESILVIRTRSGALAAHYNVCRHRGSQLVPDCRSGTFPGAIRCPYHSWTYTLEGELRTAPFLDESDGLSRGDLSLHPVGVDIWGGFLFVHLTPRDPAAPGHSLSAQLAAVPERLRRYPLAELRVARRIAYEVRANWKVMLENYNECYHCGPVHPELCRLVPAFRQRGGSDLDWEHGIPHRDGAWTFTASGTTNRLPFEGLSEEERTRHKGELVYPNLMLSLSAEHVAAFYVLPHGPDRTTIVNEFLFHPDEMAKPDFAPGDAVDFWDLVNHQDWAICESVQRGMSSRVFERGYYAPMESWSLDIRRYIGERIDPDRGS
jgi:Rieske 2Fe-2S family protein